MQTPLEVEDLLVAPPPLSAAANEELIGRSRLPSGWDPYEVWRTRIKAAQENLKNGVVLA
ncbi:MAG: hypothetical protein ACREU6_14410 [Steroidobacteraceae bacterium]